jgi:hypothetical protein
MLTDSCDGNSDSSHDLDTFVNQGFYFLGVGNADRVQCVYCAGVLSQWEAGDDIETEHRRNFPQCPLMKKKMKNPSYRDFSTRKLSPTILKCFFP